MRNALQRISESTVPEHLGLAYDRCAPLDPQTGKIPDDKRKDWLRRVASINIAPDYQFAYERWAASLKTEDTILVEVEMATRLLVGHGNPSPTEVGLTVHHTWGVPIIPGSALKGLVSHYVETNYGPRPSDTHPMDPDFPEEERDRAPFQGVTREGNRILHGPGESFRALFGAPAAKSDEKFADLGAGEAAGRVDFHDALYIPGSGLDERTKRDRPYAVDVLTVHQKSYYDAKGWNACPNDWENPVPVSFLTVRPGARFLFAASGPDAWVRLAFSLLRDALIEWGVGGKATSGYGHIRQDGWKQIWPVANARAQMISDEVDSPEGPTSVIAEFRDWLSKSLDQRPKLDLLRTEWLDRLRVCNAADKEEAARLIRKEIRSRKLVELRDALIRDIMGTGGDEKTT